MKPTAVSCAKSSMFQNKSLRGQLSSTYNHCEVEYLQQSGEPISAKHRAEVDWRWKKDFSQLCYDYIEVTIESARMIAEDRELFNVNDIDSLQRN